MIRSQRVSKKISVFRLKNDVNKYQFFLPLGEEDWSRLEMDCKPKADAWIPPPVYVLNPRLASGDFYQFGSNLLITSVRATQILYDFLTIAGELLALPYEGQIFTALNVTPCIDCLDHESTEWYYDRWSGAKSRPKKYVFRRSRFAESVIFKIPETCRGEVLVVDGLRQTQEEFRYILERANLKGLIFELLWEEYD